MYTGNDVSLTFFLAVDFFATLVFIIIVSHRYEIPELNLNS
jgi:hypothetical protein